MSIDLQAAKPPFVWKRVPRFARRILARLAGRDPRHWHAISLESPQAGACEALYRSGALVLASALCVAGAVWLAAWEAGVAPVVALCVGGTVGWCVTLLYRFVLVQATLGVSGIHLDERHHRTAIALEVALFGSVSLLVSQPLGATLAAWGIGTVVGEGSLLIVLHATNWHHPVRLLVSTLLVGAAIMPILIRDRVPEGLARVRNSNRSLIERAYAGHCAAYAAAFHARGCEFTEEARYADPPFNTKLLSRSLKPHPQGTLLLLRDSRGDG